MTGMSSFSDLAGNGGASKDAPKISNGKYVGFDLGTTNSCLSSTRQGTRPEIIPINGRRTVPSCIMLNKDGSLTVGHEAYEHRYLDCAWYSGKRDMGKDIKRTLVNGDKTLTLTPEQFSAEILKYSIKEAEKTLGHIEGVVVTVPANFDTSQVKATEDACALAGYPVNIRKEKDIDHLVKLVKEPTAGAICTVAQEVEVDKNVLVYDLGGGTFDVSVVSVKINSGVTQEDVDFLAIYDIKAEVNKAKQFVVDVLCTEGDMNLGGDDLDIILADNLLYKCKIDKSKLKPVSYKQFLLMVEKAKKSCNVTTFDFDFEYITGVKKKQSVVLVAQDLVDATKIIFDRTKIIVDKALNQVDKPVDTILLVGGSTKNVILQQMLEETYKGMRIDAGVEQDEAVALGAGILSNEALSSEGKMQVFDKIPQPIGMLVSGEAGDRIVTLLGRDTIIPSASALRKYKTTNKDASTVVFKFYEGESNYIHDYKYIGKVKVPYNNTDKENKEVEVAFTVNINGLMEVSAIIDGKTTILPLVREEETETQIPAKLRPWIAIYKNLPDSEPDKAELGELLDKAIKGDDKASRGAGRLVRKVGKAYGLLGNN